ncbi:hypothetical protein NNC19_19250 [Clostridium sp. SHJSY1]|uniref:hypothetical protein n=1 Tax=Clostridium sp. SHJSY1 TaxID=2942483 RepID=UPI002876AA26|nr:hypothetical protein [Clostridium sp. SHJSY1]MDS0527833.1 hypothetical protein [Clostridium sp. SHJSY1]
MARKKEFVMSKDDIAYEEPIDDGFSDGFTEPEGKCIATFSFSDDNDDISTDKISKEIPPTTPKKYDNRKTLGANGAAPPIDGEPLNVKRTYMLRASTVRKLNELKSINPDLNTYVSSIVDIAISEYYNSITKKNTTD